MDEEQSVWRQFATLVKLALASDFDNKESMILIFTIHYLNVSFLVAFLATICITSTKKNRDCMSTSM